MNRSYTFFVGQKMSSWELQIKPTISFNISPLDLKRKARSETSGLANVWLKIVFEFGSCRRRSHNPGSDAWFEVLLGMSSADRWHELSVLDRSISEKHFPYTHPTPLQNLENELLGIKAFGIYSANAQFDSTTVSIELKGQGAV